MGDEILKFKSIYNNEGKYKPENVLTNYFTAETLGNRFVARNEEVNEFWVFKDSIAFEKYIKSGPGPLAFHEVVFGARAQKLKFDIDMKNKDMKQEEAESLLQEFCIALKISFEHFFGRILPEKNIIMTMSHRPGQKFSFHVIIDQFHVSNNKIAGQFTSFLAQACSKNLLKYFDQGINKSTQNFRAPLCHKKGEPDRPKTFITDHSFQEALISIIGPNSQLIGQNVDTPPDTKSGPTYIGKLQLEDPIVKLALSKATEWTTGCLPHSISTNAGSNTIFFRRQFPSGCKYCGPTAFHEHENSPIVKITDSIYVKCLRAPPGSPWTKIWAIKEHIEAGRAIQEAVSSKQVKSPEFIEKLITFHKDKISDTQIYSEPKMAKLAINCPTLLIRAGMKLGKTNALIEALDDYLGPNSGLVNPRILVISFRQTFSAAIYEKFKRFGFVLYSDIKGPITDDRVIVQIESLARIDIGANNARPDIVILDESESIFEQFNSGLIHNFQKTWSIFCWIIRWAKHVVCMDAYLNDRTINVMWSLRPKKMNFHINLWEIAIEDKYQIYSYKYAWLYKLQEEIQAKRRVVMPFSSLNAAETTYEWLKVKCPNIRIGIYTSKTSATVKKQHFSDVNKFWANYDLLIYTPTISAGVSFEIEHYDSIFAYFINMSCTVETCMQMIGRIRNVKARNFHIYIEQVPIIVPTTRAGIKADVFNARNCLTEEGVPMPEFYLDEDGCPTFHKTPQFTLWIENKLRRNKSLSNFTNEFLALLSQYGAQYSHTVITNIPNEQLIIEEYTATKSSINENNAKSIAEAPDIDVSEYQQIAESMSLQQDISAQQRDSYKKYIIRRNYDWADQITPEFVIKYDNRLIKRLYKNIRALLAPHFDPAKYPGNAAILKEIRAKEQEQFKYLILQGEINEQKDLNYKYSYIAHKCLLTIISILGWNNPFDKTYRGKSTLIENIRANLPLLEENIKQAPSELKKYEIDQGVFGPNFKDDDRLKILINYFNSMLFTNYGIKIQNEKTDNSMYSIVLTHFIWKEIIARNSYNALLQKVEVPARAENIEPDQPIKNLLNGI